MAEILVYFAEKPGVEMGQVAPGVTARAQEATSYKVDVRRPPQEWEGTDITHLLNTMAEIAGRLRPGQTFKLDTLPGESGVAIVMYLTSDKEGPRLWTDRLQIRPPVFNDWWKKNLMPDKTVGGVH